MKDQRHQWIGCLRSRHRQRHLLRSVQVGPRHLCQFGWPVGCGTSPQQAGGNDEEGCQIVPAPKRNGGEMA